MSTGLSRPGSVALAALLALALVVPVAAAAPQPAARKTVKVARKTAKTAKPAVAPIAPMLPRSDAANRVIAWISAAQDNAGLPYAVIDKPTASLFLFSAGG